MIKHNQDGNINALVLPLVFTGLLLLAALVFGFWAFAGRQDYKNNVDEKVAAAVVDAKKAEGESKDKQYAEAAKLPYKTYQGPEQFGSVVLQYPKTWSAYVAAGNSVGDSLDGYFHPDVVPAVNAPGSTFALRVEVIDNPYSSVVSQYESAEGVTAAPYALPKVPKVVGVKLQGQIDNEKRGTKVVLPIRDKTLVIYTESESFNDDFNNIILPNLSFAP